MCVCVLVCVCVCVVRRFVARWLLAKRRKRESKALAGSGDGGDGAVGSVRFGHVVAVSVLLDGPTDVIFDPSPRNYHNKLSVGGLTY